MIYSDKRNMKIQTSEDYYNADTVVTLKDFPNISMTLAEMFENVE